MIKKGFTLIELLVVVLIIGILSSIALPRYQRAVEKARATEAVTQMAALTQAIDRFILENGYTSEYDLSQSLDVELPTTRFDRDMYCSTGFCEVYITSPKHNYQLFAFRRGQREWEKTCNWVDSVGKGVCEGLTGIGYSSEQAASV